MNNLQRVDAGEFDPSAVELQYMKLASGGKPVDLLTNPTAKIGEMTAIEFTNLMFEIDYIRQLNADIDRVKYKNKLITIRYEVLSGIGPTRGRNRFAPVGEAINTFLTTDDVSVRRSALKEIIIAHGW